MFAAGGPFRTVPGRARRRQRLFRPGLVDDAGAWNQLRVPLTHVVKMSVPDAGNQRGRRGSISQEGLICRSKRRCCSSSTPRRPPTSIAPLARTTSARSSSRTVPVGDPGDHGVLPEESALSIPQSAIAGEIFALFRRIAGDRGIIVQQVLLGRSACRSWWPMRFRRSYGASRESRADEGFVLQEGTAGGGAKAHRGAGRRRLPAHCRAGYQLQLLGEWKGSRRPEKLAASNNSKDRRDRELENRFDDYP